MPLRGNRIITLKQPKPGTRRRRDTLGQRQSDEPIRHKVSARRLDRGGQDSEYADTRVGEWESRFEVAWSPVTKDLDTLWEIEDERGREYEIEAVVEPPMPGSRRRWWWLYAKTQTR